jgi:Winged helix-turn-helix DNA-binding
MPDLVDRIRSELEDRIRELRPVARELVRLERAAAALARTGARSVPGLRSRVGARPSTPGAERAAARKGRAAPSTAKPEAGRAAQPRRRPAPRGQTREKVLGALAAAPGSTSAAVAKAAGISPSVAAATISRLVKQGRVRRLDEGGYVMVESPADDRGEAPPSATGADEPAPTQPTGVEAPGERPPPVTTE